MTSCVTLINDFYMIVPSELSVYYGAAALVTMSQPHQVAAVGRLQVNEGKTHILLDTEDIDYDAFRGQTSFDVVIFPQSSQNAFESGKDYDGEVWRIECQIDLAELKPAESTLCIDFDTSNTAVGTYGIKSCAGSVRAVL